MGCIQSTPADQPQKKKKGGGTDSKKKGKKSPPSAAPGKKNVTKLSPKSVQPPETPNKHKKTIPPNPSKVVSTANPLNFTKDEDKGGASDRRSSVHSSTTSLKELLANQQSSTDPKIIEHTPLSDGKRKNLCVWIDSIDKAGLLDPQDFTGQQRREREMAGRQQQQPANNRAGKRMSILNSFTTVDQYANNEQASGSVAVGHEDQRSQTSDLTSR